tara:strand:- start:6143 stop:7177 length:1035 start_codon:yes stop_codon:yes gene_type:complete
MGLPSGFWQGANMFFDDREKQRLAAEKFLAEQLTLTKSIVLPELIKRLDRQRTKRQESELRVEQAQVIGFSQRTALALERSGQLEIQMSRISDLNSKQKLDPNYIPMLNSYVSTKIENDEDLAEAIAQGLDSNSFVTESEQMEGLLLAMHSTDEEDFSKAVELLQPAPSSVSGIDPFGIGITKGVRVTEDDRRKIHNELGRNLAGNLNTRLTQPRQTEDGTWLQFEDPSVSSFLSEMVDNIVKYEVDLGTNLSRGTLINEAEDIVEAASAALIDNSKAFGTGDYGLPWAQKNFAEVFKAKMLTPDVDEKLLWQPYITSGSPVLPIPNQVPIVGPNVILPPALGD